MINNVYDIKTEADTSMVINYFDLDYIIDIVQDNLQRRIQIHQPGLPNIVAAIEQNYKIGVEHAKLSGKDPSDLSITREEIYFSILALIESQCNIGIDYDSINSNNLFNITYLIYDIFVSNYKQNLVTLFSNYIVKESDQIYKGFGLEERFKKSKDSSTIYGKSIYEDPKIAIINANIEYVLYNLGTMELPFEFIIEALYGRDNANFLLSIIYNKNNFFRDEMYASVMNPLYKNIVITEIRFTIHQMCYSQEMVKNII